MIIVVVIITIIMNIIITFPLGLAIMVISY